MSQSSLQSSQKTQQPSSNLFNVPKQQLIQLYNQQCQTSNQFSIKYEKALKQMASIVKANQSLKRQFDQMQIQKNRYTQLKLKQRQQQIQTYYSSIVSKKDTQIESTLNQNKDIKIRINSVQMSQKQLQIKINGLMNQKSVLESHCQTTKRQLQKCQALAQNTIQNQKSRLKLQRQQKNQLIQVNRTNLTLKMEVSQLQSQNKQKQKQIQNLHQKIRNLQTESVEFRSAHKKGADTVYQQNRKLSKQINTLRIENANIATELQRSKIKNFTSQNSHSQGQTLAQQKDMFQIMKELHDQLTPLRRQLIQIKKSHSQAIIKIAKERSEFQIDIIKKEKQMLLIKAHMDMIKQRNEQLQTIKQDKLNYQFKYEQTLQERNMLEGKVIVLQTMNMADNRKNLHGTINKKDRQNYQILKQFQRRMELLLQDNPQNKTILQSALSGKNKSLTEAIESTSTSLQQFIAMKTFMIDLDSKVDHLQKQNEYLLKKYKGTKQKIHQVHQNHKAMEEQYQKKIKIYKQKIYSYDKLVQKLTNELQRNIHTNITTNAQNSNLKASMTSRIVKNSNDYNSIVSLYQIKMMQMGEEMLRLRKEKDSVFDKYKQQSFLLSKNIRQANQYIRQISKFKEENQKTKSDLSRSQKELFELKVTKKLQDEYQNKSNVLRDSSSNKDYLQKSRVMGMLEDQNKIIRLRYQQQIKDIKTAVQKQITLAKQTIFELQRKNNQLLFQKQKLLQQNYVFTHSDATKVPENMHKYELEIMVKKIQQLQLNLAEHSKNIGLQNQSLPESNKNSSFNVEQLLKVQLQRQKAYWQRQVQNVKNQTKMQKQKLWLQKQEKDRKILQLQKKIKDLELVIYQKENQISKLMSEVQQYKIKSEHQISNRNQSYQVYSQNESFSQIYGIPQEQIKHLKIQMNNLSNKNFQSNLKISSLQAIIFNQKLEISRLQSSTETLQQKFHSINNQHYEKGAKIFQLQAQLRSIANMHDSQLMAKQSLLRSYQIEIKGLKSMIEIIQKPSKKVNFKQNQIIKQESQIFIESSQSLGQSNQNKNIQHKINLQSFQLNKIIQKQSQIINELKQQIVKLQKELSIKQDNIELLQIKLLENIKQKQVNNQSQSERNQAKEEDDEFLFQLSYNKINNSSAKHSRNRNPDQRDQKKSQSPKTLTLIKEGRQLQFSQRNSQNEDLVINSSTKLNQNKNTDKMNINTNNLQDVSISGSPSKQNKWNTNYENEQNYQELISQIYKLKGIIISLKDQIQLNQSKNNELRHQIYNVNLLLMKQRAVHADMQRQNVHSIKQQRNYSQGQLIRDYKIINAQNKNKNDNSRGLNLQQEQKKVYQQKEESQSENIKKYENLQMNVTLQSAQIDSLKLQLQQKLLIIKVKNEEIQMLKLQLLNYQQIFNKKENQPKGNNQLMQTQNNAKFNSDDNKGKTQIQKQFTQKLNFSLNNSKFEPVEYPNINLMKYSHKFDEYEDANFDMIRQLDCTHKHIVKIEELMVQFDKLWMMRANIELADPQIKGINRSQTSNVSQILNVIAQQNGINSEIKSSNYSSPINQYRSSQTMKFANQSSSHLNHENTSEQRSNFMRNNYRQVQSRVQGIGSPYSSDYYPINPNQRSELLIGSKQSQFEYIPTYNVPSSNSKNWHLYSSQQKEDYQYPNAQNYNFNLISNKSVQQSQLQLSNNNEKSYKSPSDAIFSSTTASKQYYGPDQTAYRKIENSNIIRYPNNHSPYMAYSNDTNYFNDIKNGQNDPNIKNGQYCTFNGIQDTSNGYVLNDFKGSSGSNLSFLRKNEQRMGYIVTKKV